MCDSPTTPVNLQIQLQFISPPEPSISSQT